MPARFVNGVHAKSSRVCADGESWDGKVLWYNLYFCTINAMTPLPLSIQTVYQDLLQMHLDNEVDTIGGTPFLQTSGGKRYWYTQQRVGDRIIKRYIGPDTDELRERIESRIQRAEEKQAFDDRSGQLIRQLRSANLRAPDQTTGKLLNAMARSGVFRLGGTLVGTHAFRLYEAELGVRFITPSSGITEDIDIAAFQRLCLVIDDSTDPHLAKAFDMLGLKELPALKGPSSGRWAMTGGGASVEFLTPSFEEEEGIKRLESLKVSAQSLHFLNFLIADPIPAVAIYRSGVLVRIPRPERYAIHKLIISQRRKGVNQAKSRKDIEQAVLLIGSLLEDRPADIRDAFQSAREKGPKWEQYLMAALENDRRLLSWKKALGA